MRLVRAGLSALAVATTIVAARCAPIKSQSREVADNAVTPGNKAVASGRPVIESARPDSLVLPYGGVVEVTLLGTGFIPGKPGQNTVHFNGTALKLVPASSDGRQIVFAIPDMISDSGGDGVGSLHLLACSCGPRRRSAGAGQSQRIRCSSSTRATWQSGRYAWSSKVLPGRSTRPGPRRN